MKKNPLSVLPILLGMAWDVPRCLRAPTPVDVVIPLPLPEIQAQVVEAAKRKRERKAKKRGGLTEMPR